MDWKNKVLPIYIYIYIYIAPAIVEAFSLPPAKFLKDFAMKHQRSAIVMKS